MSNCSVLIALGFFLQGSPCAENPAIVKVQKDGIEEAIRNVESQVNDLALLAGRTPCLYAHHPIDQQDAVAKLTDSMADNLLLTRTYLALAIAELKLVTLKCCSGCLSHAEKKKYLRHAEAIHFAIDDRILEREDIRVFRVLQAGINQSLRAELEELRSGQAPGTHSGTSTYSFVQEVRCDCCCSASRARIPLVGFILGRRNHR